VGEYMSLLNNRSDIAVKNEWTVGFRCLLALVGK